MNGSKSLHAESHKETLLTNFGLNFFFRMRQLYWGCCRKQLYIQASRTGIYAIECNGYQMLVFRISQLEMLCFLANKELKLKMIQEAKCKNPIPESPLGLCFRH